MRFPFILLACPGLFLASLPGLAQKTAPLSPLPPQNFQFAGSWDCEGAFGNGQAHKSSYAGAIVLGGKWLQLEETDLQPATHYVAEYLIGYDSQQKRLVEFDANNFGAAVYTSDEGWHDGVLIMTSPVLPDMKAPDTKAPDTKASYAANRFMFSIHGPDNFTVDWQISKTAALDWIQSDHLACKRARNG